MLRASRVSAAQPLKIIYHRKRVLSNEFLVVLIVYAFLFGVILFVLKYLSLYSIAFSGFFHEQYVKLGTPLNEADIINRFEIRLRNERAYYAVRDLLTYYDAEQTAFSIINQYVRFVDEEPDKRKNDWKLNDRWAWFIGDNRKSLKLTTKPEPYTLDRTLRWVQRQVAPTLKMLKRIDKGNGTDYMETIEQQAKLTEKHEMIKQQTTPAKRFGGKLGVIKNVGISKRWLSVST